MAAPTVPISETGHELLKALSAQTGETITVVLDKALNAYRRQLFMDQMNAGYAELRADPQAWAEHLAERKQWEALEDGLEADERWSEDGRCLTPEDGN